jgi:hypothetical protein
MGKKKTCHVCKVKLPRLEQHYSKCTHCLKRHCYKHRCPFQRVNANCDFGHVCKEYIKFVEKDLQKLNPGGGKFQKLERI